MKNKDFISFEDVMKVDIRIGYVDNAERIPKSDKLIKMEVNFNGTIKQCITNLGEHYEVEDFINNIFPFVVNMPPRKLFGELTEVMILVGQEDEINGGGVVLDMQDYHTGMKLL